LAYLKEAREVLMRLDRAGDQARRLSRNSPPELTVGFIWSFARGQAARVIAAFGKDAPDVVIHLVEDGPMGLAHRLTRSEIDICITATPDPSDIVAERIGTLQQRRLWTEDLYVVASRATPMEICSWDDLVDRTLLYRRVDAADRFAAWLAQTGGPALKFEAQDCTLDGLFTLVAAGIGRTLAPSSFVDDASETLRFIPIRSLGSTFEVIALWQGGEPNPVIQRFVDIALSVSPIRS
jgi:DNA-binding transcriptional LysR family regulator